MIYLVAGFYLISFVAEVNFSFLLHYTLLFTLKNLLFKSFRSEICITYMCVVVARLFVQQLIGLFIIAAAFVAPNRYLLQ